MPSSCDEEIGGTAAGGGEEGGGSGRQAKSSSMQIDPNSESSSDGDGRLPAIFVQPARRFQENACKSSGQIPDECLQILNREVRLLDDLDERTIEFEIGSKAVLTQEDLLDVFFLPELFKSICADTERVKSIIEIIEHARILACDRVRARKERVSTTDPLFLAWNACHFFETSELNKARTYKFQRDIFLEKRSGNILAPAAAETAVTFANCIWKDDQGKVMGAITAGKIKAKLEHRVRILRIQNEVNGEHTFGLLLIFSCQDAKLIEENQKTAEDDEKKQTEGERPVIVHLFLQELIKRDLDVYAHVCTVAVECKRSDPITVSAETFKNADSSSMIPTESVQRLKFRVKKVNEEIVDIEYEPGQTIINVVTVAHVVG